MLSICLHQFFRCKNLTSHYKVIKKQDLIIIFRAVAMKQNSMMQLVVAINYFISDFFGYFRGIPEWFFLYELAASTQSKKNLRIFPKNLFCREELEFPLLNFFFFFFLVSICFNVIPFISICHSISIFKLTIRISHTRFAESFNHLFNIITSICIINIQFITSICIINIQFITSICDCHITMCHFKSYRISTLLFLLFS